MPILTDGNGTAIRIVGSQIYLDVDAVDAAMIDSGAATDGFILTADGAGSTAWEAAPATGIVAGDDADLLGSGVATDSQVLTADGAGNSAWEDASGGDDKVSGGAGFVNVSGAVSLDLANGRAFHHIMTGNITALSFSNIPETSEYSPTWTWVLKTDATGGYTLSGMPTVTFVDGRSFNDLDLTADGWNIVTFWKIGAEVFAALVWNGTIALDPYALSFAEDGSQLIVIQQAETLDLENVTNVEADGTAGTGTLSYEKNGIGVLVAVAFSPGDVLRVTLTSSTTPTAVSIPRTVT